MGSYLDKIVETKGLSDNERASYRRRLAQEEIPKRMSEAHPKWMRDDEMGFARCICEARALESAMIGAGLKTKDPYIPRGQRKARVGFAAGVGYLMIDGMGRVWNHIDMEKANSKGLLDRIAEGLKRYKSARPLPKGPIPKLP
jgi:hypothetical protein